MLVHLERLVGRRSATATASDLQPKTTMPADVRHFQSALDDAEIIVAFHSLLFNAPAQRCELGAFSLRLAVELDGTHDLIEIIRNGYRMVGKRSSVNPSTAKDFVELLLVIGVVSDGCGRVF